MEYRAPTAAFHRAIHQHASTFLIAPRPARPIITSPHSAKLGSFSSAISAARMCIHGSTGIASLKDRKRHVCAYDCLPADYRRDISRFTSSLSLSLSLSFPPLLSSPFAPNANAAAYRAAPAGREDRGDIDIDYRGIYRRLRFALRFRSGHVALSDAAALVITVPRVLRLQTQRVIYHSARYRVAAASSTMMRKISRSRSPRCSALQPDPSYRLRASSFCAIVLKIFAPFPTSCEKSRIDMRASGYLLVIFFYRDSFLILSLRIRSGVEDR